MSYKRPSFALRKTAFQIVINGLSESKRPSIALHLPAIAQVAGVAESGNDVLMLVQCRVDCGAPYGSAVGRQRVLDVLNAVGRRYYAGHVYALRRAVGEESLVAQLH